MRSFRAAIPSIIYWVFALVVIFAGCSPARPERELEPLALRADVSQFMEAANRGPIEDSICLKCGGIPLGNSIMMFSSQQSSDTEPVVPPGAIKYRHETAIGQGVFFARNEATGQRVIAVTYTTGYTPVLPAVDKIEMSWCIWAAADSNVDN